MARFLLSAALLLWVAYAFSQTTANADAQACAAACFAQTDTATQNPKANADAKADGEAPAKATQNEKANAKDGGAKANPKDGGAKANPKDDVAKARPKDDAAKANAKDDAAKANAEDGGKKAATAAQNAPTPPSLAEQAAAKREERRAELVEWCTRIALGLIVLGGLCIVMSIFLGWSEGFNFRLHWGGFGGGSTGWRLSRALGQFLAGISLIVLGTSLSYGVLQIESGAPADDKKAQPQPQAATNDAAHADTKKAAEEASAKLEQAAREMAKK
jgi:hypothetical protein